MNNFNIYRLKNSRRYCLRRSLSISIILTQKTIKNEQIHEL